MVPEFLYHYTSVDTLELILRNRTIRFNPLYKMDDRLEQWSAHGNQEGKHVFISSWTDSYKEIPDMWRTYCKPGPECGVRIKLPVNPFSATENKLPNGMEESLKKQIYLMDLFVYQTLGVRTCGDLEKDTALFKKALIKKPKEKGRLKKAMDKIIHESVDCYTKNLSNILLQVEYSNEKEKIFPWMYSNYKGMRIETYENYGKYKDTSWAWQQEWRYRLHFRMAVPGILHSDNSVDLYSLPFDYYDLILSKEKIEQMEITMSPVISDKDREKLRQIVELYNPTALIKESELTTL